MRTETFEFYVSKRRKQELIGLAQLASKTRQAQIEAEQDIERMYQLGLGMVHSVEKYIVLGAEQTLELIVHNAKAQAIRQLIDEWYKTQEIPQHLPEEFVRFAHEVAGKLEKSEPPKEW